MRPRASHPSHRTISTADGFGAIRGARSFPLMPSATSVHRSLPHSQLSPFGLDSPLLHPPPLDHAVRSCKMKLTRPDQVFAAAGFSLGLRDLASTARRIAGPELNANPAQVGLKTLVCLQELIAYVF